MISAVNAFKAKLSVWTTHLEKISKSIKDDYDFHPEQYCVHVDKLAAEFSQRH